MSNSRTLQVPSLTTIQRDALPGPKNGMMIYNSDFSRLETTNDGGSSWDKVIVGTPGAGYIYGLNTFWASNNTVTLFIGEANDSTNSAVISLNSISTLNITNVGVVNGLDVGSETADTWYAIHLIGDSSGVNPSGGLLSLSRNSPTLPAGYDLFRRVGWVRNSSASNFIKFRYFGNSVDRKNIYYDVKANLQILTAGNALTYTTISVANLVPPVVDNEILLTYNYLPKDDPNIATLRPSGQSYTSAETPFVIGASGKTDQYGQLIVFTDNSQQIDYDVTDIDDVLNLYVQEFYDSL